MSLDFTDDPANAGLERVARWHEEQAASLHRQAIAEFQEATFSDYLFGRAQRRLASAADEKAFHEESARKLRTLKSA